MKRLLLWPLLAGVAALVLCLFLPPTYTAVATIAIRPSARSWDGPGGLLLPVQAAPLPQYGALLQSRRVADLVIAELGLQAAYGEATLSDTRERLERAVRLGGTPGGLIVVQASDRYPWRAADIANGHVAALQRLLDEMRVAAAHARADGLNAEVERVQRQLRAAHRQLLASGFDAGQLNLEPRLTGGLYGNLRQSLRREEQLLAVLRTALQDDATEVQQAQARAAALREQLRLAEGGPVRQLAPAIAHVDAQREVQRLEPLLKQLRMQAMQAELDAGVRVEAVLDVDTAKVPERPSAPVPLLWMAAAWATTLLALLARRRLRRDRSYLRSGGSPFNASTSRA